MHSEHVDSRTYRCRINYKYSTVIKVVTVVSTTMTLIEFGRWMRGLSRNIHCCVTEVIFTDH